MRNRLFTLLFIIIALNSCGILTTSSKYELKDGIYRSSRLHGNRVYVSVGSDTVTVYPVRRDDVYIVDTTKSNRYSKACIGKEGLTPKMRIYKSTLDIDVLTLPFKYRPSVSGFPNQLNTSFNGAFYLGYRTDRYSLSYHRMPLGDYKRVQHHYGYSVGAFTGIGATAMNPWVTQNNINVEYDGFIWLNGLAAIVAIQDVSFGLGIGIDLLQDRNRNVWIYQGKPWQGAAISLNLN